MTKDGTKIEREKQYGISADLLVDGELCYRAIAVPAESCSSRPSRLILGLLTKLK